MATPRLLISTEPSRCQDRQQIARAQVVEEERPIVGGGAGVVGQPARKAGAVGRAQERGQEASSWRQRVAGAGLRPVGRGANSRRRLPSAALSASACRSSRVKGSRFSSRVPRRSRSVASTKCSCTSAGGTPRRSSASRASATRRRNSLGLAGVVPAGDGDDPAGRQVVEELLEGLDGVDVVLGQRERARRRGGPGVDQRGLDRPVRLARAADVAAPLVDHHLHARVAVEVAGEVGVAALDDVVDDDRVDLDPDHPGHAVVQRRDDVGAAARADDQRGAARGGWRRPARPPAPRRSGAAPRSPRLAISPDHSRVAASASMKIQLVVGRAGRGHRDLRERVPLLELHRAVAQELVRVAGARRSAGRSSSPAARTNSASADGQRDAARPTRGRRGCRRLAGGEAKQAADRAPGAAQTGSARPVRRSAETVGITTTQPSAAPTRSKA